MTSSNRSAGCRLVPVQCSTECTAVVKILCWSFGALPAACASCVIGDWYRTHLLVGWFFVIGDWLVGWLVIHFLDVSLVFAGSVLIGWLVGWLVG